MENNELFKGHRDNYRLLKGLVKENYMEMLTSIVSFYIEESQLKEQLDELIEHICRKLYNGYYKENDSFKELVFCIAHDYMMNMYPEAWDSDNELSSKDCSATEVLKEIALLPKFQIICRILRSKMEHGDLWVSH